MGAFGTKDVYCVDDDTFESKIDMLNGTTQYIANTATDLIAEASKINNAKGYQKYVGTAIKTSVFTEYENNCKEKLKGIINQIRELKKAIDDYNNAGFWGQTFADIGMAFSKFTEGILTFGEQLVDGGATILGGVVCFGADLFTGFNSDWDEHLGNWIKEDHIGDMYYDWYEKGWLKDMNTAADFSHTSTGAQVFKMGGEIAPYIALSAVTGGGALAIETTVAGLTGTGRGMQEQLQSGKTFYGALPGALAEGTKDAAITYGAGRLAKAFAESRYADDALKMTDDADDVARLALPEKAGMYDDATRALAGHTDEGASAVKTLVNNSDEGAAAVKTLVNNSDEGAAAVKTIVNNSDEGAAALKTAVNNSDEGAAALKTAVNNSDEGASAVKTAINNTDEGASAAKTTANHTDDVSVSKQKWQDTKAEYKSAKKEDGGYFKRTDETKQLKADSKAAKTEYKQNVQKASETRAQEVNNARSDMKTAKKEYKAAKKEDGGYFKRTDETKQLKKDFKTARDNYKTTIKESIKADAADKATGKLGNFRTKIANVEGEIASKNTAYRGVNGWVESMTTSDSKAGKVIGTLLNPSAGSTTARKVALNTVRVAGSAAGPINLIKENTEAAAQSNTYRINQLKDNTNTAKAEIHVDYKKGDEIRNALANDAKINNDNSKSPDANLNNNNSSNNNGYNGSSNTGGGGYSGGNTGGGSNTGGNTGGGYTGGTVEPVKAADTNPEQLKKDDAITDAIKPAEPEKIEVSETPQAPEVSQAPSTPSMQDTPAAELPASQDYGTTYHTGGGYYGGEYVPDEGLEGLTADDASTLLPLDETLLDDNTASIDEIIKGSKYTKIPTSSKPISATSSTGSGTSAVIPIAAGLSAAAAAGIGAKAYMDRKRNNDTDEEDDEFDTEEWSEDDDSLGINYDDSSDTETYLDDDSYSYQETEKYGARSNDELADMQ